MLFAQTAGSDGGSYMLLLLFKPGLIANFEPATPLELWRQILITKEPWS